MSTVLKKSNPKNTTQSALLERFLANRRTSIVRPYLINKKVLDFGCGEHLWTMRNVAQVTENICGYDLLYDGLDTQITTEGFKVYGNLNQIDSKIDCVVSLACFEHIDRKALPSVLKELAERTEKNAIIVGTVPRPPAKPILEFLSYKLRLIDRKQIEDHKIYYDEQILQETVKKGGWKVSQYRKFQFGMNSFFILEKVVAH